MLDSRQIIELRKVKYYKSLYSIWSFDNIKKYACFKNAHIKTINIATTLATIITVWNYFLVGIDFFVVLKSFIKFRNENIEMFLNDEMENELIEKFEGNPYNWLNISKPEFRDKMHALRNNTREICKSSEFIVEIKKLSKNFDNKIFTKEINELLEDYQFIIDAYNLCVQHETVSYKLLKENYDVLRKQKNNQLNGTLTGPIRTK